MKVKRRAVRLALLSVILGALVSGGCNTSVYKDISGLLVANTVTMPALSTPLPTYTHTPRPSETPVPSPTGTATPMQTAEPLFTPTPLIEDFSLLSESEDEKISIVQDVTIPDGTVLHPGEMFVKSWRVENAGERIWDQNYRLILSYGNPFPSPSVTKAIFVRPTDLIDFALGTWNPRHYNVLNGETVDLVVPLQAPDEPGEYMLLYYLINGDNELVTPQFWIHFYVEPDDADLAQTAEAELQLTEETPEVTPETASVAYDWSGSWMIRDPYDETGIRAVQAWLVQDGKTVSGFFYNSDGEPVLIDGSLSEDQRIFEGEFEYPWQNRAYSVEWRMNITHDQFYAVNEHGEVGLGCVCGARNGLSFPDYCALPGGI